MEIQHRPLPRFSLIPHRCPVCSIRTVDDTRDICEACLVLLPWNTHACQQCALPLHPNTPATLCGACSKKAPPLDHAVVPFHYASPISDLIQDYKFGAQHRLIAVFSTQMAKSISQQIERRPLPRPDLLIPVPLHPNKHRERGFNQAALLAEALATELGIPCASDVLIKTRKTAAQSDLKKSARQKNIRGAFQLASQLEAKHIAIVDDVITTGATSSEAARTLKRGWQNRSGRHKKSVETVSLYAIARACAL